MPMQATGGSDGRVLFFDVDHFASGQVCSPLTAAQYIPSGAQVSIIKWLPGIVCNLASICIFV